LIFEGRIDHERSQHRHAEDRPIARGRWARVPNFSLAAAESTLGAGIRRLPVTLRVLLENLLRHEDGDMVTRDDLAALAAWVDHPHFEGRIHPEARGAYLVSPPLVVAYSIAGTVLHDLTREPLGVGSDGKPAYLHDIWPSDEEVAENDRSEEPPGHAPRDRVVLGGRDPQLRVRTAARARGVRVPP
jgi:aconitase A